MKITLLRFLLILISSWSFAQNTITGKIVIDDADEEYSQISNVEIENLQTSAKTKTNQNGLFSIKVNVGDILRIKSGWTQDRDFRVSKEIAEKGFVEIHVNPDLIELKEVKLHNLSDRLMDNIKLKEDSINNLYKNLGINPALRDIKVDPYATSVINNNGALDPSMWITSLTGQLKREKKKQAFFKEVDQVNEIIKYFSEDFFTELLGIPSYKINDFVNYIYQTKNLKTLYNGKRFVEIKETLIAESKDYLEKIKPELEKIKPKND